MQNSLLLETETSEIIIEFERGAEAGSLYTSGRATDIFALSGPRLLRSDIRWRRPLRWERELWEAFRKEVVFRESSGAAMLGEGGTVFAWEESQPYWMCVETEETSEIERFSDMPWAVRQSVCRRPDSLTVRFLLPAALLCAGRA